MILARYPENTIHRQTPRHKQRTVGIPIRAGVEKRLQHPLQHKLYYLSLVSTQTAPPLAPNTRPSKTLDDVQGTSRIQNSARFPGSQHHNPPHKPSSRVVHASFAFSSISTLALSSSDCCGRRSTVSSIACAQLSRDASESTWHRSDVSSQLDYPSENEAERRGQACSPRSTPVRADQASRSTRSAVHHEEIRMLT